MTTADFVAKVVHISEEVENASLTVPRVMIWSYFGNVLLGIGMLITMLFCLGPLDGAVGVSQKFVQCSSNSD